MRVAAIGLTAAVAALVAAAAAAMGAMTSNPASASSIVRIVRMTDGLQFRPARLTVPRGTRVVWKNSGTVAHTITTIRSKAGTKAHAAVPRGVKVWNSGFVAGGGVYARTLRTPGVYRYFCIPHEGAGMIGTIIVR